MTSLVKLQAKCRHVYHTRWLWSGRAWIPNGTPDGLFDAKRCVRCHAWLPLGPSSDSPPEVAVELRAAEIAAVFAEMMTPSTLKGAPEFHKQLDGAELAGWIIGMYDSAKIPEQDGEWAGYLARCIVEHTEES